MKTKNAAKALNETIRSEAESRELEISQIAKLAGPLPWEAPPLSEAPPLEPVLETSPRRVALAWRALLELWGWFVEVDLVQEVSLTKPPRPRHQWENEREALSSGWRKLL